MLEEFELRLGNFEDISSRKLSRKIDIEMKKYLATPAKPQRNKLRHFKKLLLRQDQLRTTSRQWEERIADSIYTLQNLKHLSTHILLPRFATHDESVVMPNLTHYRFHNSNTNESLQSINRTTFPNLQCLNVHFGKDMDEDININPLEKLQHLREFHIQSCDQLILPYIASPTLEVLAATCDSEYLDRRSWIKMSESLPKLHTLILENQNLCEEFLIYFTRYYKLILNAVNIKLLILREHFSKRVSFDFFIEKGNVLKVRGYYCNKSNVSVTKEDLIRNTFKDVEMILINEEEYDSKFEFWNCYFHMI